VGERFNFPTKAFSALALVAVPGAGLRHSVVVRASQLQYMKISGEVNGFAPFSYRFQTDVYVIVQGQVAGNSIMLTIGD
jgi:hypothetical protein